MLELQFVRWAAVGVPGDVIEKFDRDTEVRP
jgi:hypothetical protein